MKEFLRLVFSDNGTPSCSRILAAACTIASLFWVTYLVWKRGEWPDAVSLGGLSAYNTSHYLVNRATTAYEKANGKDNKTS